MFGSLPTYPRPFVGRVGLLDRLERRLAERGGAITLTGPGGVGKTRLAVEVARGRWRGPTGFVELQAARKAEDVHHAVAARLGLAVDRPGADVVAERLRRLGPCLLVLDNFEQVVDAAASAVDRWARVAPDARLLVTSRRPLQVAGEEVVRVDPFVVPDDPDALVGSEATLVFTGAAHSGFDPTAAPAAVLRRVLERLAGLPLALRLAAARLEVMTLDELDHRLQERFVGTLGDPRRAGGHHASLRETLDWSWSFLDDAQRACLAQCAAFAGGFTLPAAEAVVALPEGIEVLDAVHALYRNSLVFRRGERLHLLEPIRAYAAEKLRDLGLADATIVRHAAWFASAGRGWVEATRGPDAVAAYRALAGEFDNLQVVVRRDPDLARAAHVALCVCHVLEWAGPVPSRLPFLEEALGRVGEAPLDAGVRAALEVYRASWLRLSGRPDEARGVLERVLSTGEIGAVAHARALAERARAMLQVAPSPEVRLEAYRAAVTAAEEAGLVDLEAGMRAGLAVALHDLLRPEDSHQEIEKAQALASGAGDPVVGADVARQRGFIELERGRLAAAREWLGRASADYAALGMPRRQAIVDGQRALLDEAGGDLEGAGSGYDAVVDRFVEVGDPVYEAYYLGSRGRVALRSGDLGGARRRCLEAAERLAAIDPSLAGHFQACLAAERALAGDLEGVQRAAERVGDGAAERALAEAALLAVRVRCAPPDRQAVRSGLEAVRAECGRTPMDRGPIQYTLLREALRAIRGQLLEATSAVDGWWVATDGAWFEPSGQPRVEVTSRAGRGVLSALARARAAEPGAGLDVADLAEAGWPGEAILPEAAANRVRVALSHLRRAGLAEALERVEGGWRLRPDLAVTAVG